MKGKTNPSSQPDIPKSLQRLTISLEPWQFGGKTYRVIGTQTQRQECFFATDGHPEIKTVYEHRQRVLCVDTDERWWIPHERVKEQQVKAGLK